MNLLLDTHAFMWWDDDHTKLTTKVLSACRNPENVLWLSVASLWEMQIKTQLGKLNFSIPLQEKIRHQQAVNNLLLLPIKPQHIYMLYSLSYVHKDPFDRMLIAQALFEDWFVITHDSQFRTYAVNILW